MKVKKLTKKQKQLAILMLGIVVIGTGVSMWAVESNKNIIEAQTRVDKATHSLGEIHEEANELFVKEGSMFLAEGATAEKISHLQKKFNDAKAMYENISSKESKINVEDYQQEQEACKVLLSRAKMSREMQTAVNGLFQPANKMQALEGGKVKQDLPIIDDLTQEQIDAVKKIVENKEIEVDFLDVMDELIESAENQLKQINQATEAVAKVYKDKKVISTDQKLYDTAKDETDKIKNVKAQKALLTQLDKVKEDIDKNSKETAEKTTTEQKNVAQEQQKNVEQQHGQEQTLVATEQVSADGTVDNSTSMVTGNGTYSGENTGAGYTPPTTGNNTSGQGTTNGGGQIATPPTAGNGNSGNSSTPTPPRVTYTGWWYDGSQYHVTGVFDTEEEALTSGKAMYKANGSVGSWGASWEQG